MTRRLICTKCDKEIGADDTDGGLQPFIDQHKKKYQDHTDFREVTA